MERFLAKYSDLAYAVLRLVVGFLFTCHGLQKVFGLLGGRVQLSDPVGAIAGVIELVGGVMIAFGLQTGYAAFLASGLMAVAYFKAHAAKGFWPIQNRGELAVLYCFVFLYMATRGSGRYSLDALLFSRGKTVTGFQKS